MCKSTLLLHLKLVPRTFIFKDIILLELQNENLISFDTLGPTVRKSPQISTSVTLKNIIPSAIFFLCVVVPHHF